MVDKQSVDEIQRFLAEETLFSGASETVIHRLAGLAHQKVVPQGCTLFSMGQPCDRLHIVLEGSGLLMKGSPAGRQMILHRAGPGDMVGEVPFFDGKGYPASFVAETECTLLYFPKKDLIRLFETDPGLSLSLVGVIVRRLRMMASIIEQLSFEDAEHRLWDFLIAGSRNSGTNSYPRVVDPLPTREHIASAIGTVREVVSRRLSRLIDTGHIRIEGRKLVILKPLE